MPSKRTLPTLLRSFGRTLRDGVRRSIALALDVGDRYRLVSPDTIYDEEWYQSMATHDRHDVHQIAATIEGEFSPESVVDLGCGVGLYLAEFARNGIEIHGVDGAVAARDHAVVSPDQIEIHDLREQYRSETTYDVALCFEVAEHMPERYADTLVSSLVHASETVVFTAATPGQGGTHHVNEQPRDYWIDLFEQRGATHRGDIVTRLRDRMDVDELTWIPENLFVFQVTGDQEDWCE